MNITINGNKLEVSEDITILEAANMNNIFIPTLCHLKDIHSQGSCRMCVVEVAGMKTLQASCITKVKDNMDIKTNSKIVRDVRKNLYELLLSNHSKDCLSCDRNQNCELQQLGYNLNITESRFEGEKTKQLIDISPSITRDTSKCILCRRCVTACNNIQKVGAINTQNRGFETMVSPSLNLPLNETACAMCGQCTLVCPTGALKETDGTSAVWSALSDKNKRTIIQVAPAVRVALGEEFGISTGERVTGKLASALHELGFDDVFDTDFAADLTIMEEGTELLGRLTDFVLGKEVSLPIITSCSPGWIKHIEHAFPDELDHLSTCKSPHTMMGALVKGYYADKIKIDRKDIFMISVMPCTAKKYEIQRPEMKVDGVFDVDAVLTTRELAKMIRQSGIDFNNLADGTFDKPLGLSSGAADIFGVTGGVMEAALRTAYEIVTGRELPFDNLHVTPIVGFEQVKTATIKIENPVEAYKLFDGVELNIAVTSGLEGADVLMEEISKGNSPYHFIEVMGCPGGCINGGGQPRTTDEQYKKKRGAALYKEDEGKPIRKSHENPDLLEVYKEFLLAPNSNISHKYLHTHYVKRGLYNEQLQD